MFLINAIYFEGEWSESFNPDLTEDREFTLCNGIKKMHPMMTMAEEEMDFRIVEGLKPPVLYHDSLL